MSVSALRHRILQVEKQDTLFHCLNPPIVSCRTHQAMQTRCRRRSGRTALEELCISFRFPFHVSIVGPMIFGCKLTSPNRRFRREPPNRNAAAPLPPPRQSNPEVFRGNMLQCCMFSICCATYRHNQKWLH